MAAKLPDRIVTNLKTLLEKIQFSHCRALLQPAGRLPIASVCRFIFYLYVAQQPSGPGGAIKELCDAVKLVFASVFYKSPKEYVKNTSFRTEEEKMAVIIQQIVGQVYNERVYPVVSGVAQSYNYYPFSHMDPEDGVVEMALGLGVTITDGGRTYRFSPRYIGDAPPVFFCRRFFKKVPKPFLRIGPIE